MDTTLLDSVESRPVETTIVSLDKIEKVLAILNQKVTAGSKCFWVVPRIEGTVYDGSVLNRFKTLVEILGEDKVCLVHGQMSPTEREQQLEVFTNLESGVLVGTTVIEVGIDIPNANILVVEEADRFGLSPLHQLRGRIGRQGSRDLQCHCLLLSNATSTKKDSSSLTRLQILTKSHKGSEIADADLILRGSGDMLGIRQSGIQSGYTVDPSHWHLLRAATVSGRGFVDDQSTNRRKEELSENDIIEQSTTPFYDQTSSSSKKGFALRMMMILFGDRSKEVDNGIDTIQNLDISKRGELSQEDRTIHDRLIDFYDKRGDLQFVKPNQKQKQTTTDKSFTQDEPNKPHLAGFNPPAKALTLENRLNLSEDDVMFVVLDVETTGLDDKTSHLIQLAGKVLGSDDDNDLFSQYILPPIDCIPTKIEELTGITDQFLRQGGYDKALNREVGTAREFRQVYHDFQDFCIDRAQGRSIVFVAHNAKFDIRMINGELRRWRFSDDTDSAPILGDLFASSLDTLQLFRTSKFWSKSFPRPTSFSLGTLHEHVLEESISNSHNAVGDVLALERLLQSDIFKGWQSLATRIQVPIPNVKVEK